MTCLPMLINSKHVNSMTRSLTVAACTTKTRAEDHTCLSVLKLWHVQDFYEEQVISKLVYSGGQIIERDKNLM